jgi:hypothetical protein
MIITYSSCSQPEHAIALPVAPRCDFHSRHAEGVPLWRASILILYALNDKNVRQRASRMSVVTDIKVWTGRFRRRPRVAGVSIADGSEHRCTPHNYGQVVHVLSNIRSKGRTFSLLLRSTWTWIIVLSLLALVQFQHRTPPVKTDAFFFDFSDVYSASRAWLHGQNPYDLRDVYRAWNTTNHNRYLGTLDAIRMHNWAAVYPPSSLLMVSPFASLGTVPAHLLWVGMTIVLFAASLIALFQLGGLNDTRSRLLLTAWALAWAPFQSGFGAGQPALPAASLVILAVWAFSIDRLMLAGILLGAATALKMQIGAPFILYYFFIRQWRLGAVASCLFIIATFVAIVHMQKFGIDNWYADWHRNAASTLAPGQINDPRSGGPWRNDMVNLQTLADVIFHGELEVDLCVLVVFLPLLLAFFSQVRPTRGAGRDLLALSVVAALSMLPVYRRLYDGVLLMMLLTWAISRLRVPRYRGMAIAALAMLSEFFIPNDLVRDVERRTHLFDSVSSSAWWQGLVVPHHAWGLLILAVGTLYIFSRRSHLANAHDLQNTSTPPAVLGATHAV